MTAIEHVEIAAGAWQLRPPAPDEAADALAMLQDPLTVRWNPAPTVVDLASARDWCERGADWTDGTHATFSVLDATSGQNAVLQAQNFGKAIHVTGIILAKLDGTAKGGVVLSIKEKLDIPVKFVGLGETPEDIETFDPQRFLDALFGERGG